MIELILNSNKYNENAEIKTCKNITNPVTFNSPEAYIPIYQWKNQPKLYSFSIEFQTIENNGILAYILGATKNNTSAINPDKTNSFLVSLNRDFFALEIHDRFLYYYINYGSGYVRRQVVHEHVSSGKPHQIQIDFNGNFVTLKFDQKQAVTNNYGNETFDLEGPLVIGGLLPNHIGDPFSNPSKYLPPYFVSGILKHGYVGCIHDVVVNGDTISLSNIAKIESVSGISTDMCSSMPNQCNIGHCMNGGVCSEGWNRFICDCSSTGFTGPVCSERTYRLFIYFFIFDFIVNIFSCNNSKFCKWAIHTHQI